MADATVAAPDVQTGIVYWETQPASYNGVLGGYGTGVLSFFAFLQAWFVQFDPSLFLE